MPIFTFSEKIKIYIEENKYAKNIFLQMSYH